MEVREMVTSGEIINAALQVFVAFAIMALIAKPRSLRGVSAIFLAAVLLEVAIDGIAHVFGKMITHNLTVLVELPLLLIFAGVMMENPAVKRIGLLLGPVNLYFLLQDAAIEGDVLYVMYPFSQMKFVWNQSLAVSVGGFEVTSTMLILIALLGYVVAASVVYGRGHTFHLPHLRPHPVISPA